MERDGEPGAEKRAEVEASFPKAFQTPKKTVTVYDLSSLHQRPRADGDDQVNSPVAAARSE